MIVGVGELLWDLFPDGTRIVGGAPFNFAFHCHQLGHAAAIVSRVGDDELGRALREQVRALGLNDDYVQIDRKHPTGTVQVTVDASGQPSYAIAENVAWDFIEWNENLADLATRCKAICFGTLAWRQNFEVLDRFLAGHSSNPNPCIVFDVNIRQHYYEAGILDAGASYCTLLKMSDDDLHELVGAYFTRPADAFGMAKALATEPRHDFAVVHTQGKDGCSIYVDRERIRVEPVPAAVVDTVGAGDAFTAAMVCLHLEGRPLRDCARFATHYAARVCEHRGATPKLNRAEIERAAFGQ